MADLNAETYLAVVAIDFGTTYSGYAFSLSGRESDIFVETAWGEPCGIPYSAKTPSCVLTDDENQFLSLGYDAMNKLTEMAIEGEDQHVRFYEKFKMLLHDTKYLGVDTLVTDKKGGKMRIIDLLAAVLKELSEKALSKLTSCHGKHFLNEYVRWVITVPAIWPDAAKHFMKLAAVQAGIIEEVESSRLLLALEPEAASLACRQIPLLGSSKENEMLAKFSVGDAYLVIDAGGGTLDMAAHKVVDENRISELHVASGEPIGSASIDKNFLRLLDNLTPNHFVNDFKIEPGFTDLMSGFETAKRQYDPKRRQNMHVNLFEAVGDFYHEKFKKNLFESITKEYCDKGVFIKSGILVLPRLVAEGLFVEVVSSIVESVKKTLMQPGMSSVSTIALVGGFSHCTLLKDAIEEEFSEYKIIHPKEAWSAILTGAVMFGHNPRSIYERIARKTYGMVSVADFDDKKHDPSRRVIIEGKPLVTDIFLPFVRKGDIIDSSIAQTKVSTPIRSNQKGIVQRWYATFKEEPTYVDEPGVEMIAELHIPLPGQGMDRKVEVTMRFGGTCIEVESKTEDGATKSLSLDFFTW